MSLGEILVQRQKITPEQLEEAKAARKGPHDRIERILIERGFVRERDVLEIIGEQLSIPVVDLSSLKIDPELLKLIPSKVVHRYRMIPIGRRNGTIQIATANAFDLYAFDELRMLTGTKIEPVLASEAEIQRVIKQYYGVGGQV
ncbi:MAG: type II secretion system protein GspE, partial [Phycisphaerae bacterium]